MQALKLWFVALILLLAAAQALAQGTHLSSSSKKAIEAYNKGLKYTQSRQYRQAIEELQLAIKRDANFAEAHLKLGNAYRLIGELAKARDQYLKGFALLQNDPGFSHEHFHLADFLHHSGDYAGARKHLDAFFAISNPPKTLLKPAERLQASLDFVEHAMKNPVNFKPERLGDNINQFFHQYFPCVTADGQSFIYTGRLGTDPSHDEDIYISMKGRQGWSSPQPISPLVNTPANEGAGSISGDGKTLVFTACDRPDSRGGCDLYISTKEGGTWSKPVNLGPNVNSSNWDSQPSVSADGRTIYFASERPGGLGKSDIWMTRQNEAGEWQRPVNLGAPVNTSERESSPCLHASSSTLYFASEGHPGMGGVDLYRSDALGGGWTEPVNLGYPLNSPYNESTIFIDAANEKGYYSKDMGSGRNRRIEIFQFDVPNEWKSKIGTVYAKGRVFDARTKKPLGATIDLFNLGSGELTSRVSSDKVTGEYVVVLNVGEQYGMYALASQYMPHSQHFDFTVKENLQSNTLDIYLNPVDRGAAIVLQNLFFPTGQFALEDKSKTELDQVIRFLKENPKIKVEISGHTDDVGADADNQRLSERRARSVEQYLVKNGIEKARIEPRGYGEQMPAVPNTTDENRAQNRRIEMRIL